MINRYDLNAKNKSGVDIPLMQQSHAFMFQEKISPKKLESIMNQNGFMHEMCMTGHEVLNKIGDENLKLFYPSPTQDAMFKVFRYTERQRHDLVRFLCHVAIELDMESVMLPVIYGLDVMARHVSKMGLQLIPSLDMTEDITDFKKWVDTCMAIGSRDIPLLALRFATYTKANHAYDYLGSKFDDLHEQKQAVMVVDTRRSVPAKAYKSVSALHYGALLTADMSAEMYLGSGGGPGSRTLRVFSKDNLSVPHAEDGVQFDPNTEKMVFENDPQYQELFARIVTNQTDDADWTQGRPMAAVRLHEVARSHPEFNNLVQSIKSNSARDYLHDKPVMNEVIAKELKL